VTKPVTEAKLGEVLDRSYKHSLICAPQESPTPVTESEDCPCILMGEDSPDNQRLIEAYLKPTKYHLEIVATGRAAFDKYKTGRYDLVLMDLQMPVMDGLTATIMIREWEKKFQLTPVPIIALTAHALAEEAQKSLAAGCSEHLTKPIRKMTLLTHIQKWIPNRPGLAA